MRFGHVNIAARDWRRLAEFYTAALGCTPVGVERNLDAPWLSKAAGVSLTLSGRHLRLPGHGEDGPTLEIYTYVPLLEDEPLPNRAGYGHLAFVVDDVHGALAKVIEHGGSHLGEIAVGEVPGAGQIEWVYCRDPEGNVIELQRWL